MFSLALAVGAAAAERRAFRKDLAVVLVLAARPVVTGFAARMLLPVGAAFSRSALAVPSLTRPVEFWTVTRGTILTCTRKAWTLVTTAIVAGFVKTRLVKTPGAITGGTRVT